MKALRISFYGLATAFLGLLTVVGALWLWSGNSTSLSTSLNQLAHYLPAGQTLETRAVTGSLRSGGTLGWLRWQQGDISVEVSDLTIAWSLRPLLDGELRLDKLAARHVLVDDRRPTSGPTTTAPPDNLSLPIKLDSPFSVDTVAWTRAGDSSQQISGLVGHYSFDSYTHKLNMGQMHISSGKYQLSASLKALAPMDLSVALDGTVETTLPSSPQPLVVQAHASLSGTLAGQDAALSLQAGLVPNPGSRPNRGREPMQANVNARIQPWQVQPVASLDARWRGLDLAELWPQLPKTLMSGAATLTPAGAAWQATVQLSNTIVGPWDKQGLPVEQLAAKLEFLNGQWAVKSLQAVGAGGRIEGRGQFATTPATPNANLWQGSATAYNINTAAIDSRLASATLNGLVTAQQTSSGIAFDAGLQPSRNAATPKSVLNKLHLKTVHAQGVWAAPLLTLTTLALQTDDAQLQGNITFDTVSKATLGQLNLSLPGAQAALSGQLASTLGSGKWKLRLTDAALALRWLSSLPTAPPALNQLLIQGEAEITGRWQGGWQQQGQALEIQASVRAPRLDLRGEGQTGAQALHLRDWQADLAGTLPALSLSMQGLIETQSLRLKLMAQARGGRLDEGLWQGQLNSAQVSAEDKLKPGTWTAQLSERVGVNWKQSGSVNTLQVTAGAARLTGPTPGTPVINWQPTTWSQQKSASTAATEWQTTGRISGLPLAWLNLLGQSQLSTLALRGDLLFGGQWEIKQKDTLRLQASLERTSGDLLLQTDAPTANTFPAGVRDARITLTTDGERVMASLRWDSERAGQAQADLNTHLQRGDETWTWPTDAALAGTVKVRLPPVGAWSMLAPPGWRLSGTLDADAILSGTRSAPRWRGNMVAADLAVRSAVDGIDFSNGTLRASLDGEQLTIDKFTLQGAGGATGGLLSVTGAVLWLPPAGSDTKPASRLRMSLDATAQALRVSARADRRLVVSGKLSAQLAQSRLAITGTLKADSALFILPDDSASKLGDDVRVRTPGSAQGGPTTTKASATTTPTGTQMTPDVTIVLDLGPDFLVQGRGLATRLAGSVELRSSGRDVAPTLTGTLRTVSGTYRAYGQQLDIDQGVMRFTGPYDNPALDILAIRPNLQQRVGVQISGTVLSPVVRLYADPDLPDGEKLAWLVLGRSAASGGGESAMLQQAALALLGGSDKGLTRGLTDALGLDELSLGSGASGTTGATVTLGKRVSRDFYMAYERSLAGTLGTLYIFYDLSRRLTLRAQTGEQSAVDLIFTLRYD